MNGTSYTGNSWDAPWIPLDWNIVGVGDLSGDGKADLLWHNSSTGALATWVMDDTTFLFSVDIATVPLAWKVAHLAEITGDGKLDIVWQNSTTGALSIWAMNYVAYTSLAFSLPDAPSNTRVGTSYR
jgi:hypothetical protein